MATPIGVGNHVQATFYCEGPYGFTANVVNLVCTGTAGAGVSDAQLAVSYDASASPVFAAVMGANASYLGCRIQILAPVLGVAQTSSANVAVGTFAGDLLATQTCGLVKNITNRGGRSYRGRAFIAFPSEAANDAMGNPTNAYLALLQALANYLFVTATTTVGGGSVTMQPNIYSRTLGVLTPITNTAAEDEWATLRRRAARTTKGLPPV